MRHFLLASTCCLALTSAAFAETTVATKQTAPIRTSTIKNGAADDLRITAEGSVVLAASGVAVTVDSANKVTNEGVIQTNDVDNVTGILAQAGTSGGIVNSGKIILSESYAPTDGDNDGDLDGPFAVGSNRIGIATAGAYSGDIVNGTGAAITIKGNDSFGIRLGGPLTGSLSNDGTTSVLGDRAVGVKAGDISGNVRLAGTVTATGRDAVAARFDGDIGGTLTVQGTIGATGYRYTTAPADPSKLDADDLLQGGSAVVVAGNVAGGIVLAVPPKDATDADKAKGSAAVVAYGAAPAMLIGSATKDIAIGAAPATGTGYGLIVNGTITGAGVYSGVAGNGLQIGGQGGQVAIAGGIGINGSVTASAKSGSSTAVHLGAGASTPLLHVTGKVEAGGSDAAGNVATAVLIDTGASLPILRNAGTIKAIAAGEAGTARAILDASGTLGLIENSGTIAATGAKAGAGRNIAIDLSAATGDVTIRQTAVAAGIAPPAISGDIRFGNGNNLLDIADGTVAGDTYFGAGADALKLSGKAVYVGNVAFGGGAATMSLAGTSLYNGTADFGGGAASLSVATGSAFAGKLANASNLAVNLAGGQMSLGQSAQIASLAVTDNGLLAITLNEAGNTTPLLNVSGTASFAADSRIALRVIDVEKAVGDHLILSAGTLSGAGNITADTALVPYLYKATLSNAANDLIVTLAKKSSGELGLNRSEAAAFDAVYAALARDEKVAGAFLGIADGGLFRASLRQMLPDHAGGTFMAVTQGSRTFGRMLEEPTGPFKDEGGWGYWVNQVAWGTEKDRGETASYATSGWGIGGGAELKTGLGNFGGSAAYYWSRNRNNDAESQVSATQYELAGYWRLKAGGFRANARGAVSFINLDGMRSFEGLNGEDRVSLAATAKRGARLYSGAGTLAYDWVSGNLSFRPVVSLDYYRLKEKGYAETGGGDAFNLIVRSRTSDELAVSGSAVIGLDAGGQDQWAGWSRFELELGRREVVSGRLGNTVAHFKDGDDFTLIADQRASGWLGRLRGVAGNSGFQIGGELGAEQQDGNWALSLRASLRVGF